MRARDLTGHIFGRLTVIARAPTPPGRTSGHWRCRCACGRDHIVASGNLPKTKSCGCWKAEFVRAAKITHGASDTREYRQWQAAKIRCSNPADKTFPLYGGRGIHMCAEWRGSFSAFIRDMGPCPRGYELDRIDNDGPYAPTNCRWATRLMQVNNCRHNRLLEYDGRRMSLSDWARAYGLTPGALGQRLDKLHWPLARALTEAQRTRRAPAHHANPPL